ncbi:MAG: hypothetical protein AAB545_03040 [Patescibacteria group bacterium]
MPEQFEKIRTEKIGFRADEISFIKKNSNEILGILDDPEEREAVKRISEETLFPDDDVWQKMGRGILERFETKIFEFEKKEADKNAKRVLVTSDNPGSFGAIKNIIRALENDSRCKGIVALVSGVAGKQFTGEFPIFKKIHEERTVLGDIIEVSKNEPIDVALASVSVKNGPEGLVLFGAKSNLGVSKTFFLFEGYGTPGGTFLLGNNERMESIDGIFCNDEFAKKILGQRMPEYPQEKIHICGVLSSEGFELEKAESYREETRRKLGIDSNAFVVLYLGDLFSDGKDEGFLDPDIDIKTLEKTILAVSQFSHNNVGGVVIIVRPHPRDPQKENLLAIGEKIALPENLSIRKGASPLSFNGVAYASDVIVSIQGTENFFAPLRGKPSVFLAYNDLGLGGDALRQAYDEALIEEIRQIRGISIASSSEALTGILEKVSKEPLVGTKLDTKQMHSATGALIDIILV